MKTVLIHWLQTITNWAQTVPQYYFLFALGCSSLALIYIIITLVRSSSHTEPSDEAIEVKPLVTVAGNKMLIQSGRHLLEDERRDVLVQDIKDKLGLSVSSFNNDVMPLLVQFAEFVQGVPASESHHHAHPFGLLDHSLETANIALRLMGGKELPLNTPTEDRKYLGPSWKYGILCAALLHDVAKPLTSVIVDLYEDPQDKDGRVWRADLSDMRMGKRFKWYTVRFPEVHSNYKLHTQLAWSLFNRIVPMHAIMWMSETDPKLMAQLEQFLTGDTSIEPFKNLVIAADRESTQLNLASDQRVRFASAKRTPLVEKLMTGLREMCEERGAYFSIGKDAGGNLFIQDDKVFIVSKVCGDNLRRYLQDRGHRDIPHDNERIFDTLAEYNAVLRNPFDATKAIWNLEIAMKSGNESKTQVLTCLCFNIKKLYGTEKFPAPYLGTITPIDQAQATIAKAAENHEKQQQKAQKGELGKSELSDPDEPMHSPEEIETSNLALGILKTAINDSAAALGGYEHSSVPQADEVPDEAQTSSASATTNEVVETPEADEPAQKSKTAEPPAPPVELKTQGNVANLTQSKNALKRLKAIGQPPKDLNLATAEEIDEGAVVAAKTKPQNNPPSKPVAQPVSETVPNTKQKEEKTEYLSKEHSVTPDDNIVNEPRIINPVHLTQPSLKAIQIKSHITEKHLMNNPSSLDPTPTEHISDQELGLRFINWLQTGLASKEIEINNSNAFVHVVPQGLLLVTPRVFQEFTNNAHHAITDRNSPSAKVQAAFERLKLHKRNKSGVSGHHRVKVLAVNGRPTTVFTAYWITTEDSKHLIAELPSVNPHIELLENGPRFEK
ncbi:MobH family relaxase [Hydromonas duriensis]|uniref:Putative conjugal transfer nickase/helicase TraI C-term n=1 Tax=Hydromonas duriensis TaxID=1527608 RepID=A0A4V3DJK3_9BURK|nr:MobH family relaxase [Hydromonas duriensis]TDR30492.1 putative conjugal transfer nickase/helicase TraI C-term [Hydromonas duriensis]